MMGALPTDLRNQLAAVIKAARRAGESGAHKALDVLAVGAPRAHATMPPADQDLRRRLRAHGRQLGDHRDPATGAQQIDRLAHEVAYEHWHRMLFARFLAENHLLIEPDAGVSVSLDECEELARERGQDRWSLAGRFAERMLPGVFRSHAPALEVPLAPEARQELQRLLESLPAAVFIARDALGWTYQFWQAERKDAVNKSGVKIGAEELPAVTQLFTERYMVLFLLHNTVGAWRAGRILAENPELSATATSEDELREALRLQADGGYDFAYLRFVRDPRDGDEADRRSGPWRTAAGAYEGWPRMAAELRVLDPSCGSGHFLIECLDLLVRLRMEEEQLAPPAAVDAVLRDNLYGLELDPRCTQIAAFNLALTAWTWPGAGGYRPLPPLNLACSGIAPNAARDEWTRLADAAADAGGLPAKRDLLGAEDTLLSAPLRNSLGALHDLFAQAPLLGSLIDPRALQTDLYQHDYESVRELLSTVLQKEGANDEQTERAVAAQGMARAAELLAGRYHLVITNVPYLLRRKQHPLLLEFLKENYNDAVNDLGVAFADRIRSFLQVSGCSAIVLPQSFLELRSYRKLRKRLLSDSDTWCLVARIGPRCFRAISGEVVNVCLVILQRQESNNGHGVWSVNVNDERGIARKDFGLSQKPLNGRLQVDIQRSPDARFSMLDFKQRTRLGIVAAASWGVSPADLPQFGRFYYEFGKIRKPWTKWQSSFRATIPYAGRQLLLNLGPGFWGYVSAGKALLRGKEYWGRNSVVVTVMGGIPCTIGTGEPVDTNVATIVPNDDELLPALWVYCESGELSEYIGQMYSGLKVTSGTLPLAPFDVDRWVAVAAEKFPKGLPEPYSDDPTQWLFHGHPTGSVAWDEDTKRTVHGPRRLDATVLQVAVARLLGYRWPAEQDSDMRLADDMRTWVDRCRSLDRFADTDGIVCLAPVSGESAAADRLRLLLAGAYRDDWSAATERQLLAAAAPSGRPAESIEEWLRDRFFEEHCRLFHQRPFIWHVWDGRRDGFHALVNYHRIAGSNGECRRTLEALTYRHLGDWLARQNADRDHGTEGADGRLAAAQDLQNQLVKIMTGEPPCDLFVRWKALGEQPVGWEPDINDGIRINIRPFMSAELTRGGRAGAGILRAKPKITWNKDRGEEALKPRKRRKPQWLDEDDDRDSDLDEDRELRPREEYPWFWSCPGDGTLAERTNFRGGGAFDGNRWNDLHYTNAVKRAVRSSRRSEGTP